MTTSKSIEEQVAREFHRIIRVELTPGELRLVDRLNKTPKYAGACATQDFIDANESMLQALEYSYSCHVDVDDAEVQTLWGKAWDMAREHGFSKEWM